MVDKKIIQLVLNLAKQTNEGKLVWGGTSTTDKFIASFTNYSLTIEKIFEKTSLLTTIGLGMATDFDKYQPRNYFYVIEILDESGEVIDEVKSKDFETKDFPNSSPFLIMEDIFSKARRSAMGVDNALDSILNDLEKLN